LGSLLHPTLRLTKNIIRLLIPLPICLTINHDDYVSFIVVQNLEMEVRGGDIDMENNSDPTIDNDDDNESRDRISRWN
jgi:hypothetical protein